MDKLATEVADILHALPVANLVLTVSCILILKFASWLFDVEVLGAIQFIRTEFSDLLAGKPTSRALNAVTLFGLFCLIVIWFGAEWLNDAKELLEKPNGGFPTILIAAFIYALTGILCVAFNKDRP